MMQHISLFSGIGGFDLASKWMGWTNVASCEINPFGRKVLDYYWPNAYHHDDIHTLTKELLIEKSNWNEQEPTILTGGFPCQPYSTAGKRLGKEDERHLWPEMLRVIRSIRPRWVVGENVRGIISWSEGLVFEEVQADLEKEGYEVWAFLLPACGVDAPHKRDRVWFVAYDISKGLQRGKYATEGDKNRNGIFRNRATGSDLRSKTADFSNGQFTPNPQHDGHTSTEGGRSDGADSQGREEGQNCTEQFKGVRESEKLGGLRDAAYTGDKRLQRCKVNGSIEGSREKRNKQLAGCVPPNWENFPTQPPVCSRNDGLSTELDGITFPKWRNESIKAAGNAIVPQVVLQIFKTIEQFESLSLNPTNSKE